LGVHVLRKKKKTEYRAEAMQRLKKHEKDTNVAAA
jgi:hypothetical protein